MSNPEQYKFILPEIKQLISNEEMKKHLEYFNEHRMKFINAAILSSQKGFSHRPTPFKVGCSLMTISPDHPTGEYPVYFAHNFKPEPGKVEGWHKRCAERNAIQAALEHNTSAIIAIITASTETSTGDPTQAHDALHPCDDCQKLFKELLKNGVLNKKSIICNANHADPKKIIFEERTVEDLLKLYEQK